MRVQFQSDGISIVTRVLGIPIGRKWFDPSLIYGFGYAVEGHGNARLLQFNCMGNGQIVLANDVQEGETMAFLRHLHEEGFDYNTSWNLPSERCDPIFRSRS
jgi:hypothetical protein